MFTLLLFFYWKGYVLSGEIALKNNYYYYYFFSHDSFNWSLYSICDFILFILFIHYSWYMCFPEYCSILLITIVCSIISLHAPSPTTSVLYIFIFLTSLKTSLGFLPNSFISHRFFFHSSFNCFLGIFPQSPNFMFCFFSGMFSFLYMLLFSFVFHPLPHCSTTMCLHWISCFSYIHILHRKPVAHLV